jgi:hypothetical protein
MATEVFGRKYSLRIGSITKLAPEDVLANVLDFSPLENVVTGGVLKNNSEQEGYRDYVSVPPEENVIEITELHIETTVELGTNAKSSVSGATIKLRIFNLSKESQKKIKTDDSVILRAGYEQDKELPLIFAAQVITTKTRREGANIVTTITCGDSFTLRKNLRISKTYPRGTTKRAVIQDLLDQAANYGVPTGEFFVPSIEEEISLLQTSASLVSTAKYNPAKGVANLRIDATFDSGYVVHGMLFEQLAKTCDNIDFRSYLLHGSLYVEPIEFRTKQTTVEITGESIIGSIREEDDTTMHLKGDSLKQRGITLTVPLNGRITTTALIVVSDIEESDLSGGYSVVSMKHMLSLEVGNWVTEISCKRVS